MMIEARIPNKSLHSKIVSAEEAANLIKDGMNIATSGFTPSGYPKAVPQAMAKRAENGEKLKLNLWTGASVGDELDGQLARAGIINKRLPYQTNASLNKTINSGETRYTDLHLSQVAQQARYGFYGKLDIAIV